MYSDLPQVVRDNSEIDLRSILYAMGYDKSAVSRFLNNKRGMSSISGNFLLLILSMSEEIRNRTLQFLRGEIESV